MVYFLKTLKKCVLFTCFGTCGVLNKATSTWYWHHLLTNLSHLLCSLYHTFRFYIEQGSFSGYQVCLSPCCLWSWDYTVSHCFTERVRLPTLLDLWESHLFSAWAQKCDVDLECVLVLVPVPPKHTCPSCPWVP